MISGRKCSTCNKRIGAKKQRFCSIRCRNVEGGKASASKKKSTFAMACKQCAKYYYIKRSRLATSKYCSRTCLAHATIAKKANR